ncbi:PEP-CTERM/exosortase system-associated acyltransferase [Alteromonas mediterranea]|uniref:PEP-CTERM/exosortase system-associated acyltransferase n=1 Tax=Alteromonas mediterranea TaxID=314275 RepID=UPI001130FAF1|nr:PEP-CTERM/exosortase system-associated acyltransferase [Alteromonas mediterranea]QDG39178.1 PEP-CTERM/exosortase system-associated acyltransferase [Alteromonas mediterranea]
MKRNHDVETIASHFSSFFKPDVSNSKKSIEASFSIRHTVYAEELKLEPENELRLETDEFDSHSIHCLIQHVGRERFAGTVRIIRSSSADEPLPIEKFCEDSITNAGLHPRNFARKNIVEISRLAVPIEFRRRQMDKFDGAATGGINEDTYSEKELRCFPFIAIGLYLTATAVLMQLNIHHCYVMVEPRLARSMRLVGLEFEQIGPVVDYHGKRAPFFINPMKVPANLKAGFNLLLSQIMEDIAQERTFEHAKNNSLNVY